MKLSKDKKDRIAEQVLLFLFHSFPKEPFTAEIAREVVRDEEFIKRILFDLKDKNFVITINKNSKGNIFTKRLRWRLTNQIYDIYKSKQ